MHSFPLPVRFPEFHARFIAIGELDAAFSWGSLLADLRWLPFHSTIFELRGEWRRLHRASPPMRLSRNLLGSRISFRRGATAALPRPPHGSWDRLAPKRLVIANGAGTEVNAGLVELIKEAFAIRNRLLSGSDASIEAMSERLGKEEISRKPRLAI
jgi:hypothetical protein